MLADLACAVAEGAEMISDFRVMTDQGELFGLVASVSTAWRGLAEIASGAGGGRPGSSRRPDDLTAFDAHGHAEILARITLREVTCDNQPVGGIVAFLFDGRAEGTSWIDRRPGDV